MSTQQQQPESVTFRLIEVLTEESLLSNKSSSSSLPEVDNEADNSQLQPIEAEPLISLYDSTFANAQQNDDFKEEKLTTWKTTLEFQYFDHLYTSHRTTQESVRRLRSQAQSLLEEADKLQKHHDKYIRDLHQFLPKITRRGLRTRLSRPMKVQSKSKSPIPPPNTLHANITTQTRSPIPSSSVRPPPYQTRRQRATTGNQYTCFQCGSPDHFKWYCTKYRCYFCRKLSPGHSQKQCPENQPIYDDHYDDVIENEGVEQ
jgi:hypothetical protein